MFAEYFNLKIRKAKKHVTINQTFVTIASGKIFGVLYFFTHGLGVNLISLLLFKRTKKLIYDIFLNNISNI